MMTAPLSKPARIASWMGQLAAAAILAMSSLMKLSGNPDAIALFTRLGVEPWGRYGLGLAELFTALLLIRPATAARGSLLAVALGLGAIGTHLFKIGVSYGGDPSLFLMAVVVLTAGLLVLAMRNRDLPFRTR